jgi:tRNA nucleotidyltransferase/poly(A) polymerase
MSTQLFVWHSEQHAALIDGLQYISATVSRFSEIERIYTLGKEYKDTAVLKAEMRKLYKQILEYQARAVCQFDRSKVHQIARNILKADGWKSMLGRIRETEIACENEKQRIDANYKKSRLRRLKNTLRVKISKLKDFLLVSHKRDRASSEK